ncbi:UNVERIFIED_CONTAM: hypothetical protein GTU68_052271 [Idotea baltica]|nr:hypothetical protein [Idotea baltica]
MLFGGTRVAKHHVRIEAYGTVDELNSCIGLLRDSIEEQLYKDQLETVQNKLFTLGTILATSEDKAGISTAAIKEVDVEFLELAIDKMNESLPPLKNFILPGGHITVSHCHLARCVCRRAERRSSHLAEIEQVPGIVIHYLNRLSDYLFVLGRILGKSLNAEEVIWNLE